MCIVLWVGGNTQPYCEEYMCDTLGFRRKWGGLTQVIMEESITSCLVAANFDSIELLIFVSSKKLKIHALRSRIMIRDTFLFASRPRFSSHSLL